MNKSKAIPTSTGNNITGEIQAITAMKISANGISIRPVSVADVVKSLKNSKDLIEYVDNVTVKPIKHISTWDFSTLYTTIPHDKLKFALKELITKVMSGKIIFSNELQCFPCSSFLKLANALTDVTDLPCSKGLRWPG